MDQEDPDVEKIPFIDANHKDPNEDSTSGQRKNSQIAVEMEVVSDSTRLNARHTDSSPAEDVSHIPPPAPTEDISEADTLDDKKHSDNNEQLPQSPPPPGWKIDGAKIVQGIPEAEEKRNSFKYPIHTAAEKGQVKILERLLEKGDPLVVDFKKRTPLHYASGFAYQKKADKMVDIILGCPLAQKTENDVNRKQHLIDAQDKNGDTALHIAARTGHRELVEKLIFAAADVNLRNSQGIEPLEVIYSRCPAALKPVFDCAVNCKVGDPQDQNLIVNLDFGSIVGYPLPTDDLTVFKLETKLLSYSLQQSEQKRAAIILHPIVQVFLFLKWKKIRILLWISILYHVIWLLLYTLFITDLYLLQCPYKIGQEEEDSHFDTENSSLDIIPEITNDTTFDNKTGSFAKIENYLFVYPDTNGTENTCEITTNLLSSLTLELSFLYYISGSVALKEMYEIYSTPHPKFYFQQLENVGQWLLIAVVGLTSIPIFSKDSNNVIKIYPWQYQLSALGIFLAWSLILSQIGKIPKFGIFIEILGKVLRSFTMFMITFASLLVAFTVAFQILMPEKVGFENFPFGFIKVLVMMTGEIEYSDVFYSEETSSEIPFPTSTKLLYAAFVSVVTIILFNLLIGLTVSDIQVKAKEGLQHIAKLSSLSSQLEQIYLMERFIISKKVQNFLKRIKKNHWTRFFLVTQQTDNLETNMGVDIHISKIPSALQYEVREVAMPNMVQDEDADDKDSKEPETKPSECPQCSRALTSKLEDTLSDGDFKEQMKNFLKGLLDEIIADRNASSESK